MEFLRVFVFDFLASAAILVGLIAFSGLILQRAPWSEVLTGTIKTIVGFLIFDIGSSAVGVSLGNFQELFAEGFGLEGVLPLAEAVTALAQEQFGTTVSLVMLVGFVMNLVIARLTPMKYIFLTGQHNLYLAALLTIMLQASGVSVGWTIAIGGIILGFCAAFFPSLAQPGMRAITGDDEIAMGHYVTTGYALSYWIGDKVGSPEESTEDLNLPGWLNIFKDYVVGVAITMIVFFYIATFAAGREFTETLSAGQNWLVFPIFQGLRFAAGLYVIITGVRMFLGEVVNAFVGISEKLIPDAKPALDCPVVFPYAPTATLVGFLSAYAGGLVTMIVMALLGTTVIIPVAVPYFFIGGTAGVFGNASGGWKGAMLGSFIVGVLIAVGPALIYPIMANIGLTGTSFPEMDFVIVGLIVYFVAKFFG
ncbi:PTS ascorbate transporter subunit IIC [Suicoccus acidiformans]|uniref:Ascorbate-specific PTS system EIIC component n=1 Tax=Suicoccus acidiformans TaxID=2036206 RepID=A0A347WIT8_9LACT|nr:PTS ascorbate transporter subunit IIC [Suicoccus acidiformans]AXY24995.1 PTS ascorbate transporter subunit IIC [Suicoccus acidiformans]